MCNKPEGKGTVRIHFIYVVFILVAIIIIILSCRLSDNEQVTSIISFAGTVTSIILSVLAIFITVLSNDSMSGLMEKIRALTDTIRPAENHLKQASDKIETTILTLNTVGDELKEVSSKIKAASSTIESSTKGMADVICNNMKNEINDLKKIIHTNKNNTNEDIIKPADADYFIKTVSYLGLLILYALLRCIEKDKKFNMNLFSEYIYKSKNNDYFLGFIAALASARYINCEYFTSDDLGKIDVDRNITIEKIKAENNDRDENIKKDFDFTKIDELIDERFEDQ